jgi:hypothetical protein
VNVDEDVSPAELVVSKRMLGIDIPVPLRKLRNHATSDEKRLDAEIKMAVFADGARCGALN